MSQSAPFSDIHTPTTLMRVFAEAFQPPPEFENLQLEGLYTQHGHNLSFSPS